MSDVFDITDSGSEFFHDAAVAAAAELALFEVLANAPSTVDLLADGLGIGGGRRRLRLLLDVLVGYGVLVRDGEAYRGAQLVDRPPPAHKMPGWGAIADVIRCDQPLASSGQDAIVRMHLHLATAGALAADETALLLRSQVAAPWLVDLGGGAGAYSAAFLAANAVARATLVDVPEIVAIARDHLARFGSRVEFIASDIRDAKITGASAALLANVMHLHGAETCAHLVKLAATVVAPGGIVAIKDLRVDLDAGNRTGPLQSLLFALNMGIYTQDGDVHETSLLREWLAGAGLVEIEECRLVSSPNAIVVTGRVPSAS